MILNKYNLKTVSTFFLGETKDPLSPRGIFKCYRLAFDKKTQKWNQSIKGANALGIVGKYCVQDSLLVAKLFNLLICGLFGCITPHISIVSVK